MAVAAIKSILFPFWRISRGMNENVKFVNAYKRDLEQDLDPASTSTFPATLSDLTERLRHWKNVLQINVEDRFSHVKAIRLMCANNYGFGVQPKQDPALPNEA